MLVAMLATLLVVLAASHLHERTLGAFTPDECAKIVSMFETIDAEHDERSVPLLPNMNDSFAMSRVNRFASPTDGAFDWVYERMLKLQPSLGDCLETFKGRVAFNLLHEFEHGKANAFDWHADAKPGDGKNRRTNVNVMLSLPGQHFGGGTLQVGNEEVDSQQGDLVVYAAALPHRVHPLTWGRRHTLVVALSGDGPADATTAYATSAHGDAVPIGDTMPLGDATPSSPPLPYWRRMEAAFEQLTTSGSPLATEPKIHILHGEFLEGLPGRAHDAQRSFCRAYQSTDEARDHANTFFSDGVAALQQEGGPDLGLADNYLTMAACIEPTHEDAAQALQVVREAIAIRAQNAK